MDIPKYDLVVKSQQFSNNSDLNYLGSFSWTLIDNALFHVPLLSNMNQTNNEVFTQKNPTHSKETITLLGMTG